MFAFLGPCTNGRLSAFQEVAKYIKGRKVAPGVRAIAVPGSQIVALQCEKLGLDKILSEAGFEWRAAGCSMCLAMNPDKLIGEQLCASSSDRKSTRLNSSHLVISYAVFCLQKKKSTAARGRPQYSSGA